VVKVCYVLVFYFIVYSLIRTSLGAFANMIKLYGISLVLVAIFSLAAHYQFGFTRGSSSFISYPFYSDHTIYAAALAFVLPAFILFAFSSKELNFGSGKRMAFICSSVLLSAALYFSFSRAAWISIIAVLLLWMLVALRIRFYQLVSVISIAFVLLVYYRGPLKEFFKKNKVNSNELNAGLYEHVFSLTNITSDLSNAERVNRWKCAVRMFFYKPFLGFGPGTYQFKYFQYQKTEEMTPVSILEPIKPGATTYSWSPANGITLAGTASAYQGNGGSAHSEYFLALSETGIFSLFVFIALLLFSLRTGMRLLYKSENNTIKMIALFAMLGLTSYFVHGLVNNFLDDAKLAFLFWSSLSALTAADNLSLSKMNINS
jgi:putative inorganic carbon (HCO3(-)) transporter